jgi:uncharacterized membrane protein YphA (DoxX/SURF4 family)
MVGKTQALGLALLRILLGVFFIFEAVAKVGWLTHPDLLGATLTEWHSMATDWNRAYLERICLPYVSLHARVVPLAELATGLALLTGVFTRIAAGMALLMLLNFHWASGIILTYGYLTNGYGLPVLGGLLALAVGGTALPLSLRR